MDEAASLTIVSIEQLDAQPAFSASDINHLHIIRLAFAPHIFHNSSSLAIVV